MKRFFLLLLSVVIAVTAVAEKTAKRLKPLKGRIVVLTFDDATAGQREVVAPLLHKYGFGATFYVCEFPGFERSEERRVGKECRSWWWRYP